MTVEQWDALPWWQAQMYTDGFLDEELIGLAEGPPPMPSPGSGEPAEKFDPVTASSTEIGAMLGLRVIKGDG